MPKKFTFRLEKALRLRMWDEESARQELGRAVSEVSRIEQDIAQNEQRRRAANAADFAAAGEAAPQAAGEAAPPQAAAGEAAPPQAAGEAAAPQAAAGETAPPQAAAGEAAAPQAAAGEAAVREAAGGRPLNAGALLALHNYIERLNAEKKILLEEQKTAQKVVDEKMAIWQEAVSQKKALENLKERRYAEYKKEAGRAEEKELDEIAQNQKLALHRYPPAKTSRQG